MPTLFAASCNGSPATVSVTSGGSELERRTFNTKRPKVLRWISATHLATMTRSASPVGGAAGRTGNALLNRAFFFSEVAVSNVVDLDRLTRPELYRAERQHLWPSGESFRWYTRQHRPELVKAGALLLIA